MHHLVPLKIKIAIVVGLAAVLSGIGSALGAGPLSITAVVGVIELAVALLLLRSWPLFIRLPDALKPAWMKYDLGGIWSGVIKSQWTPPSGDALAEIPVTVTITQTWQELVIEAQTEKMTSRSQCAVPSFDPVTRELSVRYFFTTDPLAAHRTDNPPQQLGAALLKVRRDAPDKIVISYTNERSPGGDITIERVAGRKIRSNKARTPRSSETPISISKTST